MAGKVGACGRDCMQSGVRVQRPLAEVHSALQESSTPDGTSLPPGDKCPCQHSHKCDDEGFI